MAASPFFVFVGAKGGVGTTTVTYEVAKILRATGNVAMIDGDFSGIRSLAMLSNSIRELDAARQQSAIASARVQKITITELAHRYDAGFTINREAVEKLAADMKGFTQVLVDSSQPFAAAVRPFITRASRFFVILEPTLLGISGARSMLANLQRFGVPLTRVDLVTNQRGGTETVAKSEIEGLLSTRLVSQIPLNTDRNYGKALAALAKYIESVLPEAELEGLQASASAPIGDRRGERRKIITLAEGNEPTVAEPTQGGTIDSQRDSLKLAIHGQLQREIDLVNLGLSQSDAQKMAELRTQIEGVTNKYIADNNIRGSAEDIARLRQEVMNEALGLGPLEDLMADPSVSEIMVNGPGRVYIEQAGKIALTNKRFNDDGQLRLVIERIISPIGRRIDESSPMVDARLPDGSRVNAIIEPLALDGSTLTIRRFGRRRLQGEDLLKLGAVNQPLMDFLRACVEARLNIIISGGTGSGKTTFLNILSSFLPDRERIITIEDAAELALNQAHVVRLESRPPNIEDRGAITIRDLVRNSLRMRPDRIIIGECRGAEALDMLQAMNTGHDGSITTIHANTARDAISRVETMVMMAGFDLPIRAIREQVTSALDVIIQLARLRDGSRKVISVSEVVGMEGDIVTMQDIVTFAQAGVDKENKVIGEFQYTGVQPNCLQKFHEYGITYDQRGLTALASSSKALW